MFNIPDSLPPITITLGDFVTLDRMLEGYETKEQTQQKVAKYLERELERAEIVAAKDLPAHIVTMGCNVTYSDSRSNGTHVVTLVYPHEADISASRISILTPIGAALIGMAVGNSITWYTPDGGEQTMRVLAVQQPTL